MGPARKREVVPHLERKVELSERLSVPARNAGKTADLKSGWKLGVQEALGGASDGRPVPASMRRAGEPQRVRGSGVRRT